MSITVTPTAVTSCRSDTGQITVTAGTFKTGETVTITLQSDPVTLGTAVANAAGTVTATYNLPVGITAGQHTVTAAGIRKSTGLADKISATITVTVPAGCVSNVTAVPPPTQTPPTQTTSSQLPVTGSDNGVYIATGAGLLVAGGILVMATRKRNAART